MKTIIEVPALYDLEIIQSFIGKKYWLGKGLQDFVVQMLLSKLNENKTEMVAVRNEQERDSLPLQKFNVNEHL